MASAEYQRQWRAANRDKVITTSRAYYQKVRKHRPRRTRRANPWQRCQACEGFLASKYGSRKRRLFCDFCAESPRVKKVRQALWQRRKYQKKNGLPVEPINYRKLFASDNQNEGLSSGVDRVPTVHSGVSRSDRRLESRRQEQDSRLLELGIRTSGNADRFDRALAPV